MITIKHCRTTYVNDWPSRLRGGRGGILAFVLARELKRLARPSKENSNTHRVFSPSRVRAPQTTILHSPANSGATENGGRGGIRTLGAVSGTLLFESSTFNHSVTLPNTSIELGVEDVNYLDTVTEFDIDTWPFESIALTSYWYVPLEVLGSTNTTCLFTFVIADKAGFATKFRSTKPCVSKV